MKNIVISVPIHEQASVVENQLLNIQKFVPNSSVVLHSSADSPDNFLSSIKLLVSKMHGFVYLNPTQYHTHSPNDAGSVTGLSTVHSSNFAYINSIIKFDTFAIDTSNDMFVRPGIETIFEQYACGFHISGCLPENFRYKDVIADISKFVTVKTMEKGSQEGSFYPHHVFEEVSNIIIKMGGLVKAEEIYLPSLAFNLFPELYQQNSGSHYVYHNPSHYAVTKDDIHKVQYGEYGLRFAVKRVPRKIDDPTRIYINTITGIK